MRKFDYSFLNNGFLPASLVNLTSSIAALRTMAGVRREEYLQVFSELEAVAKIQSVKSSNAIEGIVTSDSRIAEIVNQNSAPLNHSEREIAGYRDALNEIHLNYDYIDFRESDILHLHEIMMSMAGYEFAGRYKTSDNYILEEDAQGNRRIRFRPTPAAETKQAMENFLSTLYMCYKELDKRFAVVHGKKVTKKARIEATVLNSLTPLSKADICKILPDISPTTVEAVLGNMVRTGSIRKIGSSRAIRYIKA